MSEPLSLAFKGTFSQRLQNLFENAPDRAALHLLYPEREDETLSYADLMRGSLGYAQALSDADVGAGEVAIIILQHGPELAYAFFGAVLHGAIPSIMPFLTEKLQPDQYRRSLEALFEIVTV